MWVGAVLTMFLLERTMILSDWNPTLVTAFNVHYSLGGPSPNTVT